MDTNKSGFMKTMSNYIRTVMNNNDMKSDLIEAHCGRKDLRDISEDILT